MPTATPKDWYKFVSLVGVPAAIAFFVLGMFSGLIPSPLLAMQRQMESHQQVMDAHAKHAEAMQQYLTGYTETHLRLLRQLCRQGAKTESGMLECDR